MDTVSPDKNEPKVTQSTISRFACRILIHRSANYIARVYAAGFDSSRNIFLGVGIFVLTFVLNRFLNIPFKITN